MEKDVRRQEQLTSAHLVAPSGKKGAGDAPWARGWGACPTQSGGPGTAARGVETHLLPSPPPAWPQNSASRSPRAPRDPPEEHGRQLRGFLLRFPHLPTRVPRHPDASGLPLIPSVCGLGCAQQAEGGLSHTVSLLWAALL